MGKGSGPRLIAARALKRVLDEGRALDAVLPGLLADEAESRDRALTRRLCHGVLRDWPAVDHLITQLLDRPLARRDREIHFLLAVSLSELRDGREPERAIVHAGVEAARGIRAGRLAGLANGVLRTYLRQREALEAGLEDDPVMRFGYPRWLIDRIRHDWPEEAETILAASNATPPVWLRVNRRYWTRDEAAGALDEAGFATRTPTGFADALVLGTRASVSTLPGFAEGGLSVQDGAAQQVVETLGPVDGERVLDACAAPGGKSAHVLERADVDLTAVDIDPARLEQVAATLERLHLKARLVPGDAARPDDWWDGTAFDRILIDAPCSATGVIRRHPDIRWLRRASDIGTLVETQRMLVDALWPLLKPGGILVYATCSVLAEENAEQTRSFLERHADARAIEETRLPGRPVRPGRQCLPGEADCDGFYYFSARRLRAGQ